MEIEGKDQEVQDTPVTKKELESFIASIKESIITKDDLEKFKESYTSEFRSHKSEVNKELAKRRVEEKTEKNNEEKPEKQEKPKSDEEIMQKIKDELTQKQENRFAKAVSRIAEVKGMYSAKDDEYWILKNINKEDFNDMLEDRLNKYLSEINKSAEKEEEEKKKQEEEKKKKAQLEVQKSPNYPAVGNEAGTSLSREELIKRLRDPKTSDEDKILIREKLQKLTFS